MKKNDLLKELREEIENKQQEQINGKLYEIKSRFHSLSSRYLVYFMGLCFLIICILPGNSPWQLVIMIGAAFFGMFYLFVIMNIAQKKYVEKKVKLLPISNINIDDEVKKLVNEQVEKYPEWIIEMENNIVEKKDKFLLLQEIQKDLN